MPPIRFCRFSCLLFQHNWKRIERSRVVILIGKQPFYIYLKQNVLLLKLKMLTKKDEAELILAREQIVKLQNEMKELDKLRLSQNVFELNWVAQLHNEKVELDKLNKSNAFMVHLLKYKNEELMKYIEICQVMVAALKESIANEGGGKTPLEGSILDMTSSTEYKGQTCKWRLVVADYFAPGYFVWAVLIAKLARVVYEEKNMYMAAYDWRLALQNTEVGRRPDIEPDKEEYRTDGCYEWWQKTVIIPHSMGVVYFLYFMKWVEAPAHIGGGGGPDWCRKHIM
ncbi:phospholipid:diacylglycerol acyltransferase 1-like protein [Tanacetum coccineum]